MYNEIIIAYFCHLDENTNKAIQTRANKDILISLVPQVKKVED